MVIELDEARVRIVQLVRQVLLGTQALQSSAAEDDTGRYQWIDAVLWRREYRSR